MKTLFQGDLISELPQNLFVILLHSKFKTLHEAHHCDAPNNITNLDNRFAIEEAHPFEKTRLIDIREILKMHRI